MNKNGDNAFSGPEQEDLLDRGASNGRNTQGPAEAVLSIIGVRKSQKEPRLREKRPS